MVRREGDRSFVDWQGVKVEFWRAKGFNVRFLFFDGFFVSFDISLVTQVVPIR
jgi:hypothetical protein